MKTQHKQAAKTLSHERKPRVVMLLANEFSHDTRVHKEARSLIQRGCEVFVIASSKAGMKQSEVRDEIQIVRVANAPRNMIRFLAAMLFWWARPVVDAAVSPTIRTEKDIAQEGVMSHGTGSDQTANVDAGSRPLILEDSGWAARLQRRSRRLVRKSLSLPRRVFCRLRRWPRRFIPSALRVWLLNISMARAARILRPDVVHAHDLNTLLAGGLVKRLDGARLVYDSHELWLERNIGSGKRWKDRLAWGWLERFLIGRSDEVISVAEGICDYLAKQYSIRKPTLLRNVQPFEPPAPRSRLLATELNIPLTVRIVLYPGAITVHRGLEALIDSASHLKNAAYVIMGYARNQAYLEALKTRARHARVLGSRVFFRNAVPIQDVVRYTASADLGIVPTQNVCQSYLFESSNKIFHCLMAGVPVAMSDHPEKRLIVEEHGVGVLFNETKPSEIADAVNSLLDDADRYEQMRSACLVAARTLNWECEEHRLHVIYARLINGTIVQPERNKGTEERELKMGSAVEAKVELTHMAAVDVRGRP